jgi:hypothetical protein
MITDNGRGDERKMDSVKMAVELDAGTRRVGTMANDDGGGDRMAGRSTFDVKAIGAEKIGKRVERRPSVASGAGGGDQLASRVEETTRVQRMTQARED